VRATGGNARPGRRAVSFRRAQPADIPAVVALLAEATAWAKRKTGVVLWPIPYPADRLRLAMSDGEVVVAEIDSQVVGTFTLLSSDERIWGAQPPDAGYVHRLAIRRKAAGQGFGRLLLDEAEARTRRRGGTRLRLDTLASNPRLRAYYRDLGFREVGRVRAGPPGEERDLVLLERPIPMERRLGSEPPET
jgi:ribosomal protein S18 acetylase RimI-like enzyme